MRPISSSQLSPPPNNKKTLETEYLMLYGKKFFADIIKFEDFNIGRFALIVQVGPM